MHFTVEEFSPGIYYINRYSEIKIQIIVTKKLDKEEHVWIHSLTSKMSEEHARKLVRYTNDLTDLDDKNYADSVWEVVVTENASLISRMREDKEMCSALAKIMQPELDEAFENGFGNGFDNGQLMQLFRLLKKSIITMEEAIGETELSVEEFQKRYEEYLEQNK